jgi:hypothetical protein
MRAAHLRVPQLFGDQADGRECQAHRTGERVPLEGTRHEGTPVRREDQLDDVRAFTSEVVAWGGLVVSDAWR